jgi:ATP-binding cassette subfamily F protein uup
LEASQGDIFRGTNIEVAYFDQHRTALDLDKSVIDVIADGKREVTINGNTRHVMGYLQDYLFSPEHVNAPVSTLSGGERNRLVLAKLMLKPSNLLVLDEPTNDLDVETLELLESLLVDYEGTVLLVSHDREFVDNVVTSSLVFEGNGIIKQFVGGYSDMRNWYDEKALSARKMNEGVAMRTKNNVEREKPVTSASTGSHKKLSYKDNKELEDLPKKIEKMEEEQKGLQLQVSTSDFYQKAADVTQPVLDKLTTIEQLLSVAYKRWDELESLQNNEQ